MGHTHAVYVRETTEDEQPSNLLLSIFRVRYFDVWRPGKCGIERDAKIAAAGRHLWSTYGIDLQESVGSSIRLDFINSCRSMWSTRFQ